MILSYFFLPPTSSAQVAESALYSIGFSSNILFWMQSQEYGAISGFGIPLLHTWSLSVEEQFYLIFPIFFIIALKLLRNFLIVIVIVLIVANFFILQFGGNFNLNYPYLNDEYQ